MICVCLLKECTIDEPESATSGSDFFLHPDHLSEVQSSLVKSHSIPPFAYSLPYQPNALNARDGARNIQHVPDISFNPRNNCLADLLICHIPFFTGKI